MADEDDIPDWKKKAPATVGQAAPKAARVAAPKKAAPPAAPAPEASAVVKTAKQVSPKAWGRPQGQDAEAVAKASTKRSPKEALKGKAPSVWTSPATGRIAPNGAITPKVSGRGSPKDVPKGKPPSLFMALAARRAALAKADARRMALAKTSSHKAAELAAGRAAAASSGALTSKADLSAGGLSFRQRLFTLRPLRAPPLRGSVKAAAEPKLAGQKRHYRVVLPPKSAPAPAGQKASPSVEIVASLDEELAGDASLPDWRKAKRARTVKTVAMTPAPKKKSRVAAAASSDGGLAPPRDASIRSLSAKARPVLPASATAPVPAPARAAAFAAVPAARSVTPAIKAAPASTPAAVIAVKSPVPAAIAVKSPAPAVKAVTLAAKVPPPPPPPAAKVAPPAVKAVMPPPAQAEPAVKAGPAVLSSREAAGQERKSSAEIAGPAVLSSREAAGQERKSSAEISATPQKSSETGERAVPKRKWEWRAPASTAADPPEKSGQSGSTASKATEDAAAEQSPAEILKAALDNIKQQRELLASKQAVPLKPAAQESLGDAKRAALERIEAAHATAPASSSATVAGAGTMPSLSTGSSTSSAPGVSQTAPANSQATPAQQLGRSYPLPALAAPATSSTSTWSNQSWATAPAYTMGGISGQHLWPAAQTAAQAAHVAQAAQSLHAAQAAQSLHAAQAAHATRVAAQIAARTTFEAMAAPGAALSVGFHHPALQAAHHPAAAAAANVHYSGHLSGHAKDAWAFLQQQHHREQDLPQQQQFSEKERAVKNYRRQMLARGFPESMVDTWVGSYSGAMEESTKLAP